MYSVHSRSVQQPGPVPALSVAVGHICVHNNGDEIGEKLTTQGVMEGLVFDIGGQVHPFNPEQI
jgi:hypothetical protein